MDHVDGDDSFYASNLSTFPYLLFFGTLSRIKGIDLIADAIPEVLRQHPEIHFVFIGRDDGDDDRPQMMDYVKEKAADLATHVHYHPAVLKSQLYPVIAHAKAVLMPSRVDNYPNACLEAQSLEIPVIGSYGSSLDEMIVDGVTGFLVRNEDVTHLSDTIVKLLNMSDGQIGEMKKNIRFHIQNILAEDRVVQLEQLYMKTIEEFSRKS